MAAPDNTQRSLIVEANERFWNATNYKRGQRLTQSDPADRRMMPVWMDFYRQVLREHAGEAQPPPSPTQTPQVAPQMPPRSDQPPPESAEPGSSDTGSLLTPLLVAGGVVSAGLIGLFMSRSAGQRGRSRSRRR